MARADTSRDLDELGIAVRKPILADPNIVLEAGAYRFSAARQDPIDDFALMAPYPGGRPGCVGKHASELAKEEVQ